MAKRILPYDLAQLREDVAALDYLPGEVPVKIDGEGSMIFGVAVETAKTWPASGGDPTTGVSRVVIHSGRP